MTAPAQIIILRGNSGSGKTTIAKRLQKEFGQGTILISQDVIRREILFVHDGPDTPALDFMMEMVKYGRQHAPLLILEGILNREWYLPLFQTIGEIYPVENIHAYYFDLPFHETLARHQTKPNAGEFGEGEMRRWWREKDFLSLIPEKQLTAEMSEGEIVELISAAVKY